MVDAGFKTFQKKKKQKCEPFKNLLPKRNLLQNSDSNQKSLKQLHFDNFFLVHLFVQIETSPTGLKFKNV